MEGGRRGSGAEVRREEEEDEKDGESAGGRRYRTLELFGALKMQRNLSLSGGGERA